jgi:hypothetical protein
LAQLKSDDHAKDLKLSFESTSSRFIDTTKEIIETNKHVREKFAELDQLINSNRVH